MKEISPNLNANYDLLALARQTVRKYFSASLRGRFRLRVPHLRGLMLSSPGMRYHPFPEFTIQLAGANNIELPYEKISLLPDEICIMPRGMPHVEIIKSADKPFLYLIFRYCIQHLLIQTVTLSKDKHPKAVKSITITHPRVFRMAEYLEDIAQIYHANNIQCKKTVQCLFSACLSEILTMLESDVGLYKTEPYKITQTKQLIISHLGDPDLCVRRLARLIKCSPDYLSYLFHKETGISLANYINKLRLSHAKYLLQDSVLSIKEIAMAIGYKNQSYFGRLFHEVTGQTPSTYRLKKNELPE